MVGSATMTAVQPSRIQPAAWAAIVIAAVAMLSRPQLPDKNSQLPAQPLAAHKHRAAHVGPNSVRKTIHDAWAAKGDSEQAAADNRSQVLIATVPDPHDSHLAYAFDQYVDGLQQAIQEAGYVIDRWWLPWPPEAVRPADAEQNADTVDVEDPDWHHVGVEVFRRADLNPEQSPIEEQEKPAYLILLLVGETPTTGIHRPAFEKALHELMHVRNRWQSPEDDWPIRIVGPSFSGSQHSLQIALDHWNSARDALDVRVISGAATLFDRADFKPQPLSGATWSFAATVHREELVRTALENYLANHKVQKLAILTEESTEFGHSFGEMSQGRSASEKKPSEEATPIPSVLTLYYPLHLNVIRDAYQPPAADSKGGIVTPGSKFALPLEQRHDSHDVLPALTPAITSSEIEIELANLLSTLGSEHYDAVMIDGSDVRDIIFLAGQIRIYDPDVIIATTSADLMMTRSEWLGDMAGVIVASTYPVYLPNQRWTWPFSGRTVRKQFACFQQLGIYNATLAQLDRSESLLEFGFPLHSYDRPRKRYPPVWIMAVGPRGFWPLEVQDSLALSEEQKQLKRWRHYLWKPVNDAHDDSSGKDRSKPEYELNIPRELPAIFTIVALDVGIIVLAVGYLRALRAPNAHFLPDELRLLARSPRDKAAIYETRLWAAMTITGMVLFYTFCFAAFPVILAFVVPRTALIKSAWWNVPFATSSLAAILWFVAVCHPRPRAGPLSHWVRSALAIALAAATVGCSGWDWHCSSFSKNDLASGLQATNTGIYFVRQMHFAGGLSSFIPAVLIFALVVFWIVIQLGQYQRFDFFCRAEDLGNTWGAAPDLERMRKLSRPDRGAIVPSLAALSKHDALILLVAMIVAGGLLWFPFRAPLERDSTVAWLLGTGTLLNMGLVILAILEFNKILRLFTEATSHVARTPLVIAVASLPEDVSKWLGRFFQGGRQSSRDQMRQHQVTELQGAWKKVNPTCSIEGGKLIFRDDEAKTRLELANNDCAACPGQWCQPWNATDYDKRSVQIAIAERSAELVAAWWKTVPLEKRFPHLPPHPVGKLPLNAKALDRLIFEAERLLALEVVIRLADFMLLCRNLWWYLLLAPVILFFALHGCCFQPQRLLLFSSGALVVASLVVVWKGYRALEQDAVISALSRTTPAQVTWDWSLLQHGLVTAAPLVAIVVSQFPELSDQVSEWFNPLLRALK